MSDEIRANISAMAKALCHYPSGPSDVNSCCPGIGRCEMDAAIAEITRLRAEVTTARREGMEEAAKKADVIALELSDKAEASMYPHIKRWFAGKAQTATDIADAIRAAAKEGK